MLNIEALQVRILKNLGELNSKRIDSINEKIASYYKRVDKSENSLFFFDPTEEEPDNKEEIVLNNGLMISEKEITFLLSAEQANKDRFSFLEEIVTKVYDILLLEPKGLEIIAEVIGKSEMADEESSFVKSLSLMPSNISFSDVMGVGTRLFIDNEKFKGELKLEPLVEDEKYFYSNLKAKFKEPINVGDISNSLEFLEQELKARVSVLVLN
jgi:hypothetical protein